MKAIEIEKNPPNAYYILGIDAQIWATRRERKSRYHVSYPKTATNPDGHFELAKTEFALNKFR